MPSLGIGVSEAEVEEAIEDLLGDAVVGDQVIEVVHRLDPLLAVSQLDLVERALIDGQLSGVLRLERRLALDMANLVLTQVEMVGDLPGQTVWIPAIEDDLLDDRLLLSCQFLDHALKLGTGGT